jgi:maltoporin
MSRKALKFMIALLFLPFYMGAQIAYQPINNKNFTLGSYGRIGVDWSYVNGGSIGRRLNLNNMGSIGGRLEEQDYLEVAPAFQFKPFREDDSTRISVQLRLSVFSRSLSLFGNSTTSSLGGLTIAMPEIFAEASNINNSGVTIWIGARLYRGPDVHIADHFYFNDHSGQGFGIEYKNSRFCTLFVSSNDTSSTLPPYFYLNIGTGTPSIALRQRIVAILEHDFNLSEKQTLTLLGEYQRMGSPGSEPEIEPYKLDSTIILNYPSDYGYVLGARLSSVLGDESSLQYNNFTIRYGARLANGGDGGLSKTFYTFGAPDLDKLNFNGAFSVALVDEIFLNFSEKNTMNAYIIYTHSKGGAKTNGLSETYLGQEVYNRKIDFTTGFRNVQMVSDKFQFLSEIHYSQRKDGENDTYRMTKISLSPVLSPTGVFSSWARPQLRFVASAAHYNKAAKDALYSPYLNFTGPKSWGFYFGVKAEWWIW